MQIGFYVSSSHPHQGTYFRFHNLARALTNLGHEVVVNAAATDSRPGLHEEDRDGVRYVIVHERRGRAGFGAPNNPLTAVQRGRREPQHHDVAHLFQPFVSPVLAWSRANALLSAYDWDDLWRGGLHTTHPQSWRNRWSHWSIGELEHRLPSRALLTTTASGSLAAYARVLGATRVAVIGNGLWISEPPDRRAARERTGLNLDAVYVGFMGRTTSEWAWIDAAMTSAAHEHPNVRFALCGPVHGQLGFTDPLAHERLDDLGSLEPERISDFAASLDIGLLPLTDSAWNRSRFPIKFAEYLMAGTPVLCSDVGELGDLARDTPGVHLAGCGRQAWMTAFAAAVRSAVDGRLVRVSPDDIADRLSWANLGRELATAYEETLAVLA